MALPAQMLAHSPPLIPLSSLLPPLRHVRAVPRAIYSATPSRQTRLSGRPSPTSHAFSSAGSPRRPLVTAAALRGPAEQEPAAPTRPPSGAELDPAVPPRNAGAPAVPGVHDVRPPSGTPTKSEARPAPPPEQTAEAASPSAPAATTKARPKLRALRAAVKLTPSAVEHIRRLLDQPEPKLLRIGTRRRGCSGLAYHLEYVEKADKFDEVVTQDGVEVLVEGRALLTVLGSTMDWVDEKLGSRFVFHNPNIKEQCGCGESFMV